MSHRTVRANGLDFALLEEGRGPLVLLLHGFPDTAHTWDHARAALARAGFRAVSPFMRGYAPTTIPADGDYRIDTLAADAAALIEALGERDAIVVGHDWGAATAFALAGSAPEKVRFLVTVAIPHARAMKATPALAWKLRHFVALRLPGAAGRLRKNGFAGVEALVRRWSPAWDLPAGELDAVKRAFAVPGCLEAAVAYYRAAGVRLPRALFARVTMPSLAFAGASDFAVTPAHYERARAYYDAAYEVVTLPGGHFLHREHPAQFAEALLARLPRARA